MTLEEMKADAQQRADRYGYPVFVFGIQTDERGELWTCSDAVGAAYEEANNPRFTGYLYCAKPTPAPIKLTPAQQSVYDTGDTDR